ncbi:CAP domain-containing protein [Demequina sp. TTPB684]|uniref:CAP domain-containing protein n=1 Tax=unclassified Demequina TaxID=2620311 RepID=UPI001CF401D8|nr:MULTISPECIES: CAP domain-containing protein [unclassified Demequina]MCB2412797.1 CAP domain-containing protein [Demequina sp. TTPB684]UPU87434.1 CAP domain-containing protein [Demequina sp. TMPB413]
MTTPRAHHAPSRWRTWAAPAALAIMVTAAAVTIALAALPSHDDATHDAEAPEHAPAAAASIPPLAAPAATASPEPYVSPIEVVLPPPPTPPPAQGRNSAGQRIEAAASAGVTTPAAWCEGNYGATASASSVSGLLQAANAERARWGLSALSWNSSLASSAVTWSESQAASGTLSHGMAPSPGGQNVAYRYSSAGQSEAAAAAWAHPAWMASSGHCKNILNASWSTMGAGAASVDGGNTWYLTANFQ